MKFIDKNISADWKIFTFWKQDNHFLAKALQINFSTDSIGSPSIILAESSLYPNEVAAIISYIP